MIDFYIKQNISVCELEAILGDILNFEVKFLAIADDDFTPHNNNYNFDEYPVICSYIPCVGDVALFISIFDGDKLDSERLILNIEKVAKKWQLDFFCLMKVLWILLPLSDIHQQIKIEPNTKFMWMKKIHT